MDALNEQLIVEGWSGDQQLSGDNGPPNGNID
jgi:hypothetical protein